MPTPGSRCFLGAAPSLEHGATNQDQLSYELGAIQGFFWLADRCGLALPEKDSQIHRRDLFSDVGDYNFPLRGKGDLLWPPREIWSLLALAQHHGLPTRLLDWSLDARTAAYFAASQAAAWVADPSTAPAGVSDLAVWALSRTDLKVDDLLSDVMSSLVERAEVPKGAGRVPFMRLWWSPHPPPATRTSAPRRGSSRSTCVVDEDDGARRSATDGPDSRRRGRSGVAHEVRPANEEGPAASARFGLRGGSPRQSSFQAMPAWSERCTNAASGCRKSDRRCGCSRRPRTSSTTSPRLACQMSHCREIGGIPARYSGDVSQPPTGITRCASRTRFSRCPRGFEYRLVVSYAPRTGFVGLFDRSVVRRAVTRALHKTIQNLDSVFKQW